MRYRQLMVPHLEVQHVGSASFGEVRHPQGKSQDSGDGTPVFDVEKCSPLSESVGGMLRFNANAPSEVRIANPSNQILVQLGIFFQHVKGRQLHP